MARCTWTPSRRSAIPRWCGCATACRPDRRTSSPSPRGSTATARGMSRAPRTYWTDQLSNHDSIAGYHPLGEEIWRQSDGAVDAFVHGVGTGASSRGVATVLKRHQPGVRIAAVEPAESSVLL